MKEKQLHEAVSKLLSQRLKKFSEEKKSLNSSTCTEIYTEIFNSLEEIITESKVPLGNESVNYIAQQYYDAILINGNQELDPNIFTQRAKLENIQTKEIALLAVMFKGTDFSLPLLAEIKKRS